MFSSGGGQEAAGSLRLFVGVLYTIFALLQSGGGFCAGLRVPLRRIRGMHGSTQVTGTNASLPVPPARAQLASRRAERFRAARSPA